MKTRGEVVVLRWLVQASLVASILLISGILTLKYARALDCAARPEGSGWTWRDIDNKRCWYPWPRRNKNQLRWPVADAAPVVATKEEVVATTTTFEQRWRNLLLDMAFPFWQDSTPIKDQSRFNTKERER